jgi:NAD(P)-dependent dehydrogenase (short-subunit alcohol dehydrogenase family)
MAIDYAPHGIRVNAICPATVPTPLVMASHRALGYIDDAQIEESMDRLKLRYGVPLICVPKVMAWTPLLLTASVVPKWKCQATT